MTSYENCPEAQNQEVVRDLYDWAANLNDTRAGRHEALSWAEDTVSRYNRGNYHNPFSGRNPVSGEYIDNKSRYPDADASQYIGAYRDLANMLRRGVSTRQLEGISHTAGERAENIYTRYCADRYYDGRRHDYDYRHYDNYDRDFDGDCQPDLYISRDGIEFSLRCR